MNHRLLITVGALALLGGTLLREFGPKPAVQAAPVADLEDSWSAAAAEFESQLGLSADYRREWITGTLAWPGELEELSAAALSERSDRALSAHELADLDRIVAPHNERIEGLSNAFLDLVDGELFRAWKEGRYEAARVDSQGNASFPPTPGTTLVSSNFGNQYWIVRLVLDKHDVPELAALKHELHVAKADRGVAVTTYLRELAVATRPEDGVSEATAGSR